MLKKLRWQHQRTDANYRSRADAPRVDGCRAVAAATDARSELCATDGLGDAWGETIDVGPGRFDLITRLDKQLAQLSPGCVLERCKTKYGTLRYYAHPEDGEDIDAQMTFNEIIRVAKDESAGICEDCGEPGQQVTLHGWIWKLCDMHTQHRLRSTPAR